MTLLATPGAGLIAPVPWLNTLCCPAGITSLYHLPHVAQVEHQGRSTPFVAAFTPQLAVVHRGFAAGLCAKRRDDVADFLGYLLTEPIPLWRVVTAGALRDWCQLPTPSRSPCGPPCNGLGLVQDYPPIVCPRCGGYGVGEDREDGFGWIGTALVDRRELARVIEHLPPAERVEVGCDLGGGLWLCGRTVPVYVWQLGQPARLGRTAPRFAEAA